MEDLNVNRDKPDITDEQILKHKNFDAVMNTAVTTPTKLPWYKVGKFWIIGGSASIIVVVTALIVANINDVVKTLDNPEPLIEGHEEAIQTTVDVIEDNTIDENAEIMFHITPKTLDVFTPLNLKIEVPSAVMIDNEANESNTFDVLITSLTIPDEIELASHSRVESFQLDLSYQNNAVELFGADAIIIKDENISILESTENGWVNLKKIGYANEIISVDSSSEMLRPIQNTAKSFVFEGYGVKEQVKEYYEIAEYENLAFQPITEQKEVFYKTVWNDVFVTQVEPGRYKLRLLHEENEYIIYAEVVFLNNDLQKAKEKYSDSFSTEEMKTVTKGHFHVLQNGGKYIVLYP